MKKTVKSLIAIILSLTIVFSFAGCSKKAEPIVIDSYNDGSGMARTLLTSDVEAVAEILESELSYKDFRLISVYACGGAMYEGTPVHIIGIDTENAETLGFEKLEDGVLYFENAPAGSMELEINVTEVLEEGEYQAYDIEKLTYNTESGVETDFVKTVVDGFLTPSCEADTICFVNMKTYTEIASAYIGKEIKDIYSETHESELLDFKGIIVETGREKEVQSILGDGGYHYNFVNECRNVVWQ